MRGYRCEDGGLKIQKTFDGAAVMAVVAFLACFVLSFASASIFLSPGSSNAVTGLTLADDPYLAVEGSAPILDFDITPTANGALAAGVHSLGIATNVPSGYGLALEPVTMAPELQPGVGTVDAPTMLDNNSWGFALEGMSGFDAHYGVPTPSETSAWAGLRASTTVKRTDEFVENDVTDVYYGIKADMSLPTGVYANTVRYTAMPNMDNLPIPRILYISKKSGTTSGGTAIEIVGRGFTVNDASVTQAVEFSGRSCTEISISSNTPTVGEDTIYCNTPAHPEGYADLVVNTWMGPVTHLSGFLFETPATVSFVSPSVASILPGTESGPVFTVVGTGFVDVRSVTIGGIACEEYTIISDTQIFCKAHNGINGVGKNEVVVATKDDIKSDTSAVVEYSAVDYPTFQDASAFSQCDTTARLFRDERDSQLYYVKKMADEKCWMVDNLKYANFGMLSSGDGNFLTVDRTNTWNAANVDVALYVDPGATSYCAGSARIPADTNTRCGLLYNWYAVTNGSGTFADSVYGSQMPDSICPANFRLPSIISGLDGPTTDGTSYTAADWAVLAASMNAGSVATGVRPDISSAYWQPEGEWGGMFTGFWDSSLSMHGSYGHYWSSTIGGWADGFGPTVGPTVAPLYFLDTTGWVLPLTGDYHKYNGMAARCVMDNPAPEPPVGTRVNNISSTNPAAPDVYPTTGWEGETIAITSNAQFVDVTSVTVGGANCKDWAVATTSLISCVLPAKAAGSTNDVTVYSGGKPIAFYDASAHMKITYFDPNSSKVSVGGVSYNYYPNGFTSTSCTALTASNAAIGSTPAGSMAYFRDTRNRQVYRVKKMADGKCWMVDNLKYIDTEISNRADRTVGMIYNSGDHLGSGETGKFNTVDGSNTMSTANLDKAFYNNPMSEANCSSARYVPTGSLTYCGYLYNWYAATNGTGTYAQSTSGNQVSGSICPKNFRLPSAMSGTKGMRTNGTDVTVADFPVLNASMQYGKLDTGTTASNPAGWQPAGAWGGTFSGHYASRLGWQGTIGYYWSTTAQSPSQARYLHMGSSSIDPNAIYSKMFGFAVRCVMP